jgi:hypothetical protein
MDWGGAAVAATFTGTSVSSAYLLPPLAARGSYVDPTIMRILMRFGLRIDFVSSNNSSIVAGVIAWDDVNDTVPTDPPLPRSNPELDWMIRSPILLLPAAAQGSLIYQQDDTFAQSSAKRRLGNQSGLLLVVESGSNATVSWGVDVRYLLKE